MSKKKKKKQNNQQAVSMPDQNGQQRIPTKEELINEQILNDPTRLTSDGDSTGWRP